LEPDSVLDISHETLIRQWQRLQAWTIEESEAMRQQAAEAADEASIAHARAEENFNTPGCVNPTNSTTLYRIFHAPDRPANLGRTSYRQVESARGSGRTSSLPGSRRASRVGRSGRAATLPWAHGITTGKGHWRVVPGWGHKRPFILRRFLKKNLLPGATVRRMAHSLPPAGLRRARMCCPSVPPRSSNEMWSVSNTYIR
jgi:hypothetical protein